MKIRLVDGSIYDVARAEVTDGRLEIDFTQGTAEEVQEIFSVPANLGLIEVLTDDGEAFGALPGWTVYGGLMLNGNVKTVILTKQVNITEKRLTDAESDALAAKTATEAQQEDIAGVKQAAEAQQEEISGMKQATEAQQEDIAGMRKDMKAGAELLQASAVVSRANAQSLPDAQALEAKILYSTWEELVGMGYMAEKAGYKFTHEGVLYKTVKDGQQFQAQWVPGQGTESIYTRIDEAHAGTAEDPIPYSGNMELEKGKYYSQDGITYLCSRDTGQPVFQPLKDLVGIYVEAVS